jgi:hypothetical protein
MGNFSGGSGFCKANSMYKEFRAAAAAASAVAVASSSRFDVMQCFAWHWYVHPTWQRDGRRSGLLSQSTAHSQHWLKQQRD